MAPINAVLKDAEYVTFLRDPVERLVSYYFYVKRIEAAGWLSAYAKVDFFLYAQLDLLGPQQPIEARSAVSRAQRSATMDAGIPAFVRGFVNGRRDTQSLFCDRVVSHFPTL